MNLQVKRFIAAGLVAGSILAMAGTALAGKPVGNNRPGWGVGDTNHVHTGPPGNSTHPPQNP